jgi:hypothetical protein
VQLDVLSTVSPLSPPLIDKNQKQYHNKHAPYLNISFFSMVGVAFFSTTMLWCWWSKIRLFEITGTDWAKISIPQGELENTSHCSTNKEKNQKRGKQPEN